MLLSQLVVIVFIFRVCFENCWICVGAQVSKGEAVADSFRIGTVIFFVFRAGIIHRTIHAKFVLPGPPYFGKKLRLPFLSLSPSGQIQARRWRGRGVQQVDSSRDSSLPFPEGNEGPVVGNHSVAGSFFLSGFDHWFKPWSTSS